MDTDFATTQARYREFLARTPHYLASTLQAITTEDHQKVESLCLGAKRIFFTATGSSKPAALYGVYILQQAGLPASFLPTGSMLGLTELHDTDLVILCSQGMNRADASLVVSAVQSRGAKLVVFTANRDTPLTEKADAVIYFDPDTEKLFCRPSGVATNVAAMAAVLDSSVETQSLVQAWEQGQQDASTFNNQTRYVVLASDMMLPANWNMALALREGCGILAQDFDIETYAHGNYVGDLTHGSFEYIVLTAEKSTEAARSVRRFMPFIVNSKVPHTVITAPFADAARANLYVLGLIAQAMYDTNEADQYNMNKPLGKEANRYYHELESYER